MKSAYELAMERLEAAAPTQKLTDAQKAEIAEIETRAKARTAEKELLLGDLIAKARASADFAALASLEKQLADERQHIRDDAEAKKESVRSNR